MGIKNNMGTLYEPTEDQKRWNVIDETCQKEGVSSPACIQAIFKELSDDNDIEWYITLVTFIFDAPSLAIWGPLVWFNIPFVGFVTLVSPDSKPDETTISGTEEDW